MLSTQYSALAKQEADANALILEIWQQKTSSHEHSYALPEHLEEFKKSYQAIVKKQFQLPIIPMISPRTQKKISAVPSPNGMEKILIEKRSHELKRLDPSIVYDKLSSVADSRRAQAHRNHVSLDNVYGLAIPGGSAPLSMTNIGAELELDKSSVEYFESVARRKLRQQAQLLSVQQPTRPKKNSGSSRNRELIIKENGSDYPFDSPLKRLLKTRAKPQLSSSGPLLAVAPRSTNLLSNCAAAMQEEGNKSFSLGARSQSMHEREPGNFENPLARNNSHRQLAPLLVPETRSRSELLEPRQDLGRIYKPIASEVAARTSEVVKSFETTLREAESTSVQQLQSKELYSQFLDKIKCDVLDELGVDIDQDFTRRRKFGHAVQMIVFYVNACKLRTAFFWFRNRVRHATHALKMAAAITISCAYRRMKSRHHMYTIRHNLDIQRRRMEAAEKKAQERLNLMSALISGRLRHKLIKARVRRRFAAVKIQSLVRGIRARTVASELAIIRKRLCYCAIVIQCAFRQHLARRRYVLEAKLLFVNQWMENIKAIENGKRLELRRHGAAQRIQSAFRRHRLGLFLRRLLYWHRMEIVMLVQKRFRGFLQRIRYRKVLAEKRRREKRKYDACVQIQRIARGRIHYLAYERYKQRKLMEKEERFRRKKLLLEQLKDVKKPITWKDRWYNALPMKYQRDGVFATKIQRVFRGFRARKRVAMLRIKLGVINRIHRQQLRQASAIVIQRLWRGKWARLLIKKSKRQEALIILQCFFRQRRAIWVTNKKRAKIRAFQLLGRNLHSFLRKIVARRLRHMQIKFGGVVLVIQRVARRYLGKLKLLHRKHSLRYVDEQRQYGEGKLTTALCAVQLRLIVDSMQAEIGKKNSNRSDVDCPCHGPIQALFIAAVGQRARTETSALITNKLDSKNFSKFSFRLSRFINDRMLAAAFAEEEKINPRKKPSQQSPAVLIDAIANDRFVVIKGVTGVSQTDLDLIFSEAKEDPTEGSTLTYKEFVACMDILANIYYKKEAASKKGKLKGKKSQPGPSNNANMGETSTTRPRSTSPTTDRPGSRSLSPTFDSYENGAGSIAKKGRRKSRFDDSRNLMSPLAMICGPSPHFGLLLCLQLMAEYRYDKWMVPVSNYLEVESRSRLGLFVTRIQCMIRKHIARLRKAELVRLRDIRLRELALSSSVVLIQSVIRRFIASRRVCRLAQTFIIKYVLHDATTYWYNPSTRVSTWTKPKILRDMDCSTIPLPETGLEVMVRCSNCDKGGEVTCIQCEDTYCNNCYFSIHCKGNRRKHTHKVIAKCSFCKFQVATKNCMTCILAKPVRGSAQWYMKESDRGRYCDPCFCHAHDQFEIKLSQDVAKKRAMLEFVTNTKEAYILGQHLHQNLKTDHKFDHIVQTCEECLWRCASWRCEQCEQIYCHKCLVGLHAAGGPFHGHKAEKLPFYTREMHIKYQKDAEDQIMASRMQELIQSTKVNDDEKRYRAVLRIQKWWRGRYYARAGKAFLKMERKKIRHAWRLRKKEDAESRQGFVYRLRYVFGRNEALATDTREEAALRQINIFGKEKARAYIVRNLEDWGWYRVSATEPRKGIPRTGFDVGSVDELMSQAKLGGVRLPGKIILQNGKSAHKTTLPLLGLVTRDKMIRIQDHLFYVRDVDEDEVILDRKWLYQDYPNGELMYCVPSTKDEEDGIYYQRLYSLRLFMLNNPISQSAIHLYISFLKRLSSYAIFMAKTAKKNGSIADAIEWRDMSNGYNQRVKQLSQYLLVNERKVKPAVSAKSTKSTKSKKEPVIADGGASESAIRDSSRLQMNSKLQATSSKPTDLNDDEEARKQKFAEEMKQPMHLRFGRTPGVRWTATPEELLIRKEQESKMTTAELISTAGDWEEEVNPMTGTIFYHNKVTDEICDSVPRSVQMKRQVDEDSLAAKNKVKDAAAKMDVATKKSAKMTAKRR